MAMWLRGEVISPVADQLASYLVLDTLLCESFLFVNRKLLGKEFSGCLGLES